MKKRVLATIVAISAISSVGFASPMTDYSQGNVAVDLSVRASNHTDMDGNSGDGKTANFNYGLTVGMGDNWAFQYKKDNADSKTFTEGGGNTGHTELESNQYNVLYKLDQNLSAFVGLTNTKAKYRMNASLDTDNAVGYQVGLVGTMPLAPKLTGYASLGLGNKITDYQIGLGYEVFQNVELNVGYQDTKFKKLHYSGESDFDYKAHGMTYGLTYKF